jgi:N-acetylmuramoyl-L-alanine amidase
VGAAERANAAARAQAAADAAALAVSLSGLRVVLDVQHLFKVGKEASDRGTLYALGNGTHVYEAQATTAYGAALAAWLKSRGAAVLTNEPKSGILTGDYPARNAAANAWGAHAYLALHVNAGGGDYALAEYMVGSPGQALGAPIGAALCKAFRDIRSARCNPLVAHQRGAVCVEGVDRHVPALILEPFFGDNVRQQALFAPEYLVALGGCIGIGIAYWWQAARTSATGAVASRR